VVLVVSQSLVFSYKEILQKQNTWISVTRNKN